HPSPPRPPSALPARAARAPPPRPGRASPVAGQRAHARPPHRSALRRIRRRMNDAPALPGESGRRPGKASRRSCQEAVTGPGGSRVRRSARIFAHALSPRSHAMRSALMYGTIATLVLGLAACAEPPAPTAPPRPSFATGRRGPAVFVTDVSRAVAPQDETPIAVNPRNTSNILTGANDFNLTDGCACSVRFAGGRTGSRSPPRGFIPVV